jgi:mRNA interferase MazF
MKGKIVLIPFPFTDLTATKLRPALVLHEGDHDVVLAFISSKTHARTGSTGVMVATSHAGFLKSGLKVDSVIRLDKIATVLKDLMVGELGELDDNLKAEVNAKLVALFRL